MALLSKEEKINRIIKSMKYKHGIDEDEPNYAKGGPAQPYGFGNRTFDPVLFGAKDLNTRDIRFPSSTVFVAVPIPSPYKTKEEAISDPKYQHPEYRIQGIVTVDANGVEKRADSLVKCILDVTGCTEVPVSNYYDGNNRRNIYGYFLYNGKCYINPQNVYCIGSTVITLDRFKEIEVIRQQLTGLPVLNTDGWHLGAKFEWQRWVLTNYYTDAELTAAVATYKPIYDYFRGFYFGFDPNA
jgi:hypothetical protein